MRIMGNLRKAGNLLEKKSFIVTVIVLNCIVISLLTGYLFFLKEKDHSVDKPAVATILIRMQKWQIYMHPC